MRTARDRGSAGRIRSIQVSQQHSRPGDPHSDEWQISTDGKIVQHLPAEETRLLVNWDADIIMDLHDMRVTLDHSDDLTHDRVFDVLISDLRSRGEAFTMPTDPLNDPAFVQLLTKVYDPGLPTIIPPEYGVAAE